MRFFITLLFLCTSVFALDFGFDAMYAQMVLRPVASSNTQTSLPTATGTLQTSDTTSALRSENTILCGVAPSTTTSTGSSTVMAALAPAMRTNDVRLTAAGVGLAAVAIGMGML